MFKEVISFIVSLLILLFPSIDCCGIEGKNVTAMREQVNQNQYEEKISYSGEWVSDDGLTSIIDSTSIRIYSNKSEYVGTFANPKENTDEYSYKSVALDSTGRQIELSFENDTLSFTLDGESVSMTKSPTVMRFIAMSDIHVKDKPHCIQILRFEKAIRDMYIYASNQDYGAIDALIIDGDFANNGRPKQMRNLKNAIEDNVKDETQVHFTLASHEFGYAKVKGAVKNLKKYFGQAPDEHFTVNGFDFITVSCDEDGCGFSDTKKNFAADELAKANSSDPTKPIFFFQHPHIKNTVYGSIGWGNDFLTPILSQYPQVIDFSGHSHAPVNDPRNVYQKDFTCLGTGSLSYTELDEFDKDYGTVPPDADSFAQFLVCDVTADGTMTARAYDVLSAEFFDCDKVIYKSYDKNYYTYTDARFTSPEIPEFSSDASLTLNATGAGRLQVKFDQAMTNVERPNSYYITVRDANGKELKTKSVWSSYYINYMPDTIEVDFSGLPLGKVSVEVKAKGYWENMSSNSLTGEIVIK